MPKFQGRRVAVGFGIEATPGTEVAAADWVRQLSLGFQRRKTTITNDSAMGRIEKTNDSAVVARWADGDLNGKINDITFGYLLYALFGTVSSANASGETTVKTHTFTVNNTNTPPTLTLSRKDPNTDRRHGLATLDKLEVTWEAGDWVKFVATLRAKPGVAATSTPAYVVEREFTSKHVSTKLATNLAGLAGATALAAKSGRITLTREQLDPFIPNGSDTPTSFDVGSFTVDGELVLQYTDTTLEDLSFNNTIQSLSIAMINTDEAIGVVPSRPGLIFTCPRVRLNTFEMSDDLDSIVEQTVGFTGELDVTAGYLVQAALTNTKTAYTA